MLLPIYIGNTMQLLLTEPYGHQNGDSVSITFSGKHLDTKRLKEILLNHSCYKPAIPKIISCLLGSNRYDCVLQPGWFRKQAVALFQELAVLDIKIIVTQLASTGEGKIKYDTLAHWKYLGIIAEDRAKYAH
jgi:hypothetical protein